MTLIDQIAEYKDKENELKKEAQKIKINFKEYINNQSIPLVTRWDFFCKAPDEFKNHERYLIRANSKGLEYVIRNWFTASEVYGRGKQIFTAKIFDDCI